MDIKQVIVIARGKGKPARAVFDDQGKCLVGDPAVVKEKLATGASLYVVVRTQRGAVMKAAMDPAGEFGGDPKLVTAIKGFFELVLKAEEAEEAEVKLPGVTPAPPVEKPVVSVDKPAPASAPAPTPNPANTTPRPPMPSEVPEVKAPAKKTETTKTTKGAKRKK